MYSVRATKIEESLQGAYSIDSKKLSAEEGDSIITKIKKRFLGWMVEEVKKNEVLEEYSYTTPGITGERVYIPVDAIVEEILAESRNLEYITGNRVDFIIVGRRDYLNIQTALDVTIPIPLRMCRDSEMIQSVFKVPIKIVPWFNDILLVPKP